MSRLKTKLCDFNEETGKATYIYAYDNQLFEGTAQCHEDDMDINSKTVGLKYAETRAYLQYLRVRRKELLNKANILENLQRNMMTSKDFVPRSNYSKKLQFEICETRCELNDCRQAIDAIPGYLRNDIEARDGLYKKLREKRKAEEVKEEV